MSSNLVRLVSNSTVALWATSAAIGAVSLLTLIGWAADRPALTTWRPGTVPMAPLTAVLSLFFSTALFLAAVRPARPAFVRTATVCAWTGLLVAVALLALRLTGLNWSIELLGLPPRDAVSGPTSEFVSAITASMLSVINLTLLVTLSPRMRTLGRSWPAIGVSAAIAATALGLLLVAAFDLPLVVGGGILPVALSTSVVLFVMGLALLDLAVRPIEERPAAPRRIWEGRTIYVAIYAGVVVLTVTGGYAYYRMEEVHLRQEIERELEVVSALKLSELTRWRAERIADAHAVLADALLVSAAGRLAQGGDDPMLLASVTRLLGAHVDREAHYDRSFVIDGGGTTRLSTPEPAQPASATLVRQAANVLRSGQVAFIDFYLDDLDRRPHLAVLVPVAGASPATVPLAVIVLRIDPEKFLYPFIQTWPGPRQTAETLLVRRQGNDVLFLNHLRFDPKAAMRRRFPLTDANVLAVQAVRGRQGVAVGVDYRGGPALGVLRAVPASPWFLVARITQDELNTDLLGRLWMVVAFTTVLLMAAGAGLALAWRDQRARFYRAQALLAAALRESEERLRLALNAADQGLYDLNVQTGEAIVSPEYATMLGYDPATFHETIAAWLDRMHPADREAAAAGYFGYVEGRGDAYRIEFRDRTASGDWRWLLSVGRVVARTEDGRPLRMLGTRTDITARKVAEIQSQRLSQHYAALSQCNEAIVRCTSEVELFPKICEAAVTQGGMAMAWVGLTDEVSGLVRPVAWFGRGTDYLADIEISVDADRATGRGPTGTAVRENRPYWLDDFKGSPITLPWHDRAEQFGWAASVGLPLTRGGRPVGALTIYAFTPESFDADGRRLLTQMATDISFALETFARDAERMASAEALRRSAEEKEALLREVHHRVKNNLQVITSMVRLESGRSNDSLVKTVLGEMKNRILSMALLHETLYRSGNLASVDLSVYLAQLATQLVRTVGPASGRLTLCLDLAPTTVALDEAIPCGLLVNELVCNAIKHAFPDGRSGEIAVSLHPVEGGPGRRLTVADTGVGLPADFEARRATSLGLQLVSDLARQLRGTVSTESVTGACFAVSFTPGVPITRTTTE